MEKIYNNSVDEIMDALEAAGAFDDEEGTEDSATETEKE